MARDHARLFCEIWNDDEFTAAPARAQRMYVLALSQPTISYAGVLPLQLRRWSGLAPETTPESVRAALGDLESHFVVVDEDTEEVFIRSYMRHDGVMNNPNVAVAAARAYKQIASKKIRRAWLAELARLEDEMPEAKAWTDKRSGVMLRDLLDCAHTEGFYTPFAETPSETASYTPQEPPSEPLPEGGPETPSEGGLSTRTRTRGVGVGVSSNPAPKPSASGEAPPDEEPPDTTQAIVGEWIKGCRKRPPKNVIGQISKHVKALIEEDIDPAEIREGLKRWADKGDLHPSVLPSIVNEVMNANPGNAVAVRGQPDDKQAMLARAFERAAARDAAEGRT